MRQQAFSILLLSFIPILISLEITSSDNLNPTPVNVLSKEGLISSDFDYFSQLTSTCSMPSIQHDDPQDNYRDFNFTFDGNRTLTINLTYDNTILGISSDTQSLINGSIVYVFDKPSTKTLRITYDCSKSPNYKDNMTMLFSLVTLNIFSQDSLEDYSISYMKVCQTTTLYRFDLSFLILAALSMIIIFFGIRHARITSFQRHSIGLSIKWWMSLFYIFFAIGFTAAWGFYRKATTIVVFIIMLVISFLAVTFALKELLYYLRIFECCNTKVRLWKLEISILTVIYSIMAFVLVLCWAVTFHYVLTNVLALFIVFASFKVLKITSLQSGAVFLLIIGIFDIVLENVLSNWENYPLQKFDSQDLCYPFKFMIPTFSSFLTKRCSWLSVSNLIFPGLFLSYFHRFDSSKHIKVYFLMGFMGYLCGNGFWIMLSIFAAYSTPLLLYAFPFMIGFCSLLAYKRNENLDLWKGLFYDYDLVFANIKSKKEMAEAPIEKEEVFNKVTLFEGLLDSSMDSQASMEERKTETKEMSLIGSGTVVNSGSCGGGDEERGRNSQVKNKIKAFEGMGFIPGQSLSGKDELNRLLKKNQH